MCTCAVATEEVTIASPNAGIDRDDVIVVAAAKGRRERLDGDAFGLGGIVTGFFDFGDEVRVHRCYSLCASAQKNATHEGVASPLVGTEGVEPSRIAPQVPKTCASAISPRPLDITVHHSTHERTDATERASRSRSGRVRGYAAPGRNPRATASSMPCQPAVHRHALLRERPASCSG